MRLTSTPESVARIGSPSTRHQEPSARQAGRAHFGGVVVGVSEHEAHLLGQLLYQQRSHLVVGDVGRGEPGRKRYPHPSDGGGQMELPAIHSPVPARFQPMRLGVYGGVGHFASLAVFLVPYSTLGLEHG